MSPTARATRRTPSWEPGCRAAVSARPTSMPTSCGTSPRSAPRSSFSNASERPDVLRLFALAAGRNVELDLLAFMQRLVTIALNVGVVDEHVVATLAGNESEALLGIEELHGTCSQLSLISSKEPAGSAGRSHASGDAIQIGRVQWRHLDRASSVERLDCGLDDTLGNEAIPCGGTDCSLGGNGVEPHRVLDPICIGESTEPIRPDVDA